LAITKKIAEAMGGTAGVTSTAGKGSTFWFTAVLRKAGQPAGETAKVDIEDAERAIQRDHAGKHILLADDEPINREIAQMLLEDVGLKVDLAGNGQEAVEKARSGGYVVIVMDMQMPLLDGLDATREIRRLPGCKARREPCRMNRSARSRGEHAPTRWPVPRPATPPGGRTSST
jgi:CheY-like chemotaxis protein